MFDEISGGPEYVGSMTSAMLVEVLVKKQVSTSLLIDCVHCTSWLRL